MHPEDLTALLKREVTPALGCTEPAAIALASAKAYSLIGGSIKKMQLTISPNIFKNAKAVGIPCTEHTGVDLAAVLGTILEDPPMDLTIFSGLSEAAAEQGLKRLAALPLDIEIPEGLPGVYIDIGLETDHGSSRAVIAQAHTNFVYLQKGETVLLDKGLAHQERSMEQFSLSEESLESVILAALSVPSEELGFLLDGVAMNMAMVDVGLKIEQGLRFGQCWQNLQRRKLVTDDLCGRIALYTAAACDARMAGIKLPIMSSAGSGNHGLIAIIPVATVAEHLQIERGRLIHALALSHLVNLYIKEFTGRLSPICGCAIAAGSGAGAAITYLLDGDLRAIQGAVTNVISNLAGMICDGGKVGCALKLCTSAVTAWWSALLAGEGLEVPVGNGIVGANINDTIANLGKLTTQGMGQVDKSVTSILEAPRRPASDRF